MSAETRRLLRIELHLHTSASKDSLVHGESLFRRCEKIGIDRFAVTDHNVIDGALKLKALAPDKVIVGEEIETSQGELIAYFVKERVPPGLEPMETIKRLRDQGAVISIPHPFDTLRIPHWKDQEVSAIVPYVDAIESFNARCLRKTSNEKAKEFAKEHNLLETVGSDAHSLWEVGRATLTLPHFSDADSFLDALKQAVQSTRLSSPLVHIYSRIIVYQKILKKS